MTRSSLVISMALTEHHSAKFKRFGAPAGPLQGTHNVVKVRDPELWQSTAAIEQSKIIPISLLLEILVHGI